MEGEASERLTKVQNTMTKPQGRKFQFENFREIEFLSNFLINLVSFSAVLYDTRAINFKLLHRCFESVKVRNPIEARSPTKTIDDKCNFHINLNSF